MSYVRANSEGEFSNWCRDSPFAGDSGLVMNSERQSGDLKIQPMRSARTGSISKSEGKVRTLGSQKGGKGLRHNEGKEKGQKKWGRPSKAHLSLKGVKSVNGV